ncbi:MAG: carbohydrate ABC transporter permease [Anaerolineae bacterium]|mgnify:CR=1 FL=1|nr:carbohydrate ABC transporter permease [Anaerolineae bacterium]
MIHRRFTAQRLLLHAFLIGIACVWFVPTVGVFVTSFRTPFDVASSGWWTVFRDPLGQHFTLDGYRTVIEKRSMDRAFLNSFIITVPATIIPIIIAAFAAMAYAWMRFPLRMSLFGFTVALVSVPLQATVIPILTTYNQVGLTGRYLGVWLVHTGYGLPLIIYFLHNFFKSLPHELFDSAAIDGASSVQTLLRIVLPLSVPALASIAIFQFLWVWNDLFVALIYLGGAPGVAPLTVSLSNLVGSRGEGWELLTAAAFVSSSVPLVVFFTLQRYFVRGMLAGSIKA